MKSILYGMLLTSISLTPAFSDYRGTAYPFPGVTLVANNASGVEADLISLPFARDFHVQNVRGMIPPGWEWVQFSIKFYEEGTAPLTSACSAYGEGQDAASYDMMIPVADLPQDMPVVIRIHDFGGTPSYDCAVYPKLPVHSFRPRH